MTSNDGARSGPTLAAWAAIAALGLVWGGTFLGVKLALAAYPPLWIVAPRLTLASLALLALVPFVPDREGPAPDRARWPFVVAIGAVGAALPYLLLAWGQQHVSSGFAGVSMAAVALFVLPLAHVLVPEERMTWARSAGVAMGFAGVVALFWGRLGEGSSAALLGQIAAVAAAGCYAVSSIVTRLVPPIEPVRLAAAQTAVGAAIMLPVALAIEGPPTLGAWTPTVALVTLALLPTALANLLRVFVIRTAGAQFMSLTNYQVPVWAVLFGALFLGEEVPSTLLVALALILGGIAATQAAQVRRLVAGRRGPTAA